MRKGISKRRRKARVLKVLRPFFAQSGQGRLQQTLAAILMSGLVTIKLPKVAQRYVRFEDLGARHSFTHSGA